MQKSCTQCWYTFNKEGLLASYHTTYFLLQAYRMATLLLARLLPSFGCGQFNTVLDDHGLPVLFSG
jgi:hypothetical protein